MDDLTPEGLEAFRDRVDRLRLELLLEGNQRIKVGKTGFTPESELLILSASAHLEQASLALSLSVIKQRQALASSTRGSI